MRAFRFLMMMTLAMLVLLVYVCSAQTATSLYSLSGRAPNDPQSQAGFKVLYTFATEAKGEGPTGIMIDPMGNIYGTTGHGGITTCPSYFGCGTAFRIT